MKNRAVLQMDQAKFEDQNLSWHFRKCGFDPDLDSALRVSHPGLVEIQSQIGCFNAANTPAFAAQSLRQTQSHGAF